MKKLLMIFLSVMATVAIYAQSISVQGTVIDADNNEPLIGVSVLEVGTTNGVVTDLDGNFTLSVKSGAKLQLSYVGYTTQELAAKANLGTIMLKRISSRLAFSAI